MQLAVATKITLASSRMVKATFVSTIHPFFFFSCRAGKVDFCPFILSFSAYLTQGDRQTDGRTDG